MLFVCLFVCFFLSDQRAWAQIRGGGGGGQGDVSPHVLEGGGHNIKCPPPPRFWGWMIIHLYNDPFYMVCDVVDPFSFLFFLFFLLVRKVCHVGWVLCV